MLLDLLDRVEALETQSVPLGYMGPPAYDSGWVSINRGQSLTLTHNLNTKEVLVYVIGKDNLNKLTQVFYGASTYNGFSGLYWIHLDNTTYGVHRGSDDQWWEQVRVMIWIIQEPPS